MIDRDDASLESMLRTAKLREPGEGMDARVEGVFANYGACTTRPPYRMSLHRIGFHRLAIAAGILLAIGIGVRLSIPKPPPTVAVKPVDSKPLAESHPIQFETDTATVIDDGVVATEDGVYQQYRRRVVREIFYEDPATHAKLQVTIPTEQLVIQKVESY
jgi:hypothetical protein